MIPEGTYKARGVEAALGITGTGKEQVAVLLTILEGDHAGDQITWYGYFTPPTQQSKGTIARTFDSLRALGWQGDDLTDLTGIDANEVYIVIEHEDDREGKRRARVKWINSGGGLAMKERLEGGAAQAFAQRMKGAALASRSKTQPRQAAPRPATSAPRPQPNGAMRKPLVSPEEEAVPFEDDIPF
jgi:hypothetical protein